MHQMLIFRNYQYMHSLVLKIEHYISSGTTLIPSHCERKPSIYKVEAPSTL